MVIDTASAENADWQPTCQKSPFVLLVTCRAPSPATTDPWQCSSYHGKINSPKVDNIEGASRPTTLAEEWPRQGGAAGTRLAT
ncbi:hypothetical protein IF2G_09335 [Cordyceps javanica]|nr:hypothetical protein IF2G_09335 [Cordyceps javanica]